MNISINTLNKLYNEKVYNLNTFISVGWIILFFTLFNNVDYHLLSSA